MMPGNPCEPDHACDRCDRCEGRTPDGIPRCCGAVPLRTSPQQDPESVLFQAMVEDASEHRSLRHLMELDARDFGRDSSPEANEHLGQLMPSQLALRASPVVSLTIPQTKDQEGHRVRKTK